MLNARGELWGCLGHRRPHGSATTAGACGGSWKSCCQLGRRRLRPNRQRRRPANRRRICPNPRASGWKSRGQSSDDSTPWSDNSTPWRGGNPMAISSLPQGWPWSNRRSPRSSSCARGSISKRPRADLWAGGAGEAAGSAREPAGGGVPIQLAGAGMAAPPSLARPRPARRACDPRRRAERRKGEKAAPRGPVGCRLVQRPICLAAQLGYALSGRSGRPTPRSAANTPRTCHMEPAPSTPSALAPHSPPALAPLPADSRRAVAGRAEKNY